MNKTATEIPKALFDATVKSQISTGRYASKVVRDPLALSMSVRDPLSLNIAVSPW